jgi:hypothetical protein
MQNLIIYAMVNNLILNTQHGLYQINTVKYDQSSDKMSFYTGSTMYLDTRSTI